MDFEYKYDVPDTSPGYILPDDPPDIKPDLDIVDWKNEVENIGVTFSSATDDDPLDIKHDQSVLVSETEEIDNKCITSSPPTPDDPLDIKHDFRIMMSTEEKLGNKATISSPPVLGSAMFVCKWCSYRCREQARMVRHVKQNHGHIKRGPRHKCRRCDFSTDNPSILTKHRRTHRIKRRFRCCNCGKTFNNETALICHYKTHASDKPMCCGECGMVFTNSELLQRHKRTHIGEKVCACDKCEATFARMSNCIVHYITTKSK